jgi:undecaprenyl-diphosphatase
MDYWQALIVGLLQGMTEILPVSSTAHLVLLPKFLGFESLGLEFDVVMNFGSWLAIMVFFGKIWKAMLTSGVVALKSKQNILKTKDQNLILLGVLLLATIPAILVGLLFGDVIENYLRSPLVVAIALIVGAVILWISDRYGKTYKKLSTMTWQEAVLIGIMQSLAMIPGVSRSGACIMGGRFLGFDKKESATFAFLLGAPVILAATISVIPDLWAMGVWSGEMLVAFGAAILGTYMTIGIFYEFIKKQSLLPFVVYRIVLGIFILATL